MKILVGADICPINRNEDVLTTGQIAPETLEVFRPYDLRVANLECPLSQAHTPATKFGEQLRGVPNALLGLKELGINLFALANNHIMDHGPQGLEATRTALRQHGIPFFGAGSTLEEAALPYLFQQGGSAILFLAFTEHYFAAVSSKKPGANYLEVPHLVRSMLPLPKNTFKVVLLHGGNEQCPYPSPALRDVCHLLVELGADIVIVQHTHCIGAHERFGDRDIFYGQGNFIFDYPLNEPSWRKGFLIDLDIRENRLYHLQLIPFQQAPGPRLISVLAGSEKQHMLDQVAHYSAVLGSGEQYDREWMRYCDTRRAYYEGLLRGHGAIRRKLGRFFSIEGRFPPKSRMQIYRSLQCLSRLEELKTLYSL